MTSPFATIVRDQAFLECPRWHEGRIWFVDFYTHVVLSAAADGSDRRHELEVPQQPSGLGWLPDGRLLVVSMRDRTILRQEPDGTLAVHADLSGHVTGHLNDMVVDDRGRAWVGEFGFDLIGGAPLTSARLLRVEPDGSVHVAAEDLLFPNGSVITDDRTLLVCETFGNRITAFDIAEDGSLGERRVWAEFGTPAPLGALDAALAALVVAPDGCCLDAEGALWVADAIGGRVLRVLEGGTIDTELSTGSGAFACMLGGDEGRTLFVCSAPDFHEQARRNAREGVLLSAPVRVGRAGRP